MSPDLPRLERRRRFSQAEFDAFAALSGDDNPIHVDPAYAARTRFARPVAHGMLLLAVVRGMAQEIDPAARLTRHEVKFPAPAGVDEPLAFCVEPANGAADFQVISEQTGEVVCEGRLLFGAAA